MPTVSVIIPTHTNQIMSLFWLIVAATLSVGAAHLLYRFVERPSLKLTEKRTTATSRPHIGSDSKTELEALPVNFLA